jgi:hypothetical protein
MLLGWQSAVKPDFRSVGTLAATLSYLRLHIALCILRQFTEHIPTWRHDNKLSGSLTDQKDAWAAYYTTPVLAKPVPGSMIHPVTEPPCIWYHEP